MLCGVKAALVALAASFLVSGCGGSDSDEGGGQPKTKKLPPPSAYDCTRTVAPERTNAIPVSCATDRACPTRLVSGHRGVGGDLGVLAPEDTVSAVYAAVAIGSDFVETDPRPTKDGVLVNLHDPDVDRTTNGTGVASDMTLAEIQALQIDASKFEGDFSCEHVPTLEEILDAARGRIHVLIDANKTDRVDLLVKAIQDTDTLDWAIFDTDSSDKISEALTLEPKLHTMIRVADTVELDSELQLFSAHPPVIVELHDGADVSTLVPAVHAAGNRALTDVFGVDLSAKFSNDASLYETVFADGVDIAQTDRPELALEYLGR
jgi:glycerophosphoryl diester phosphodiesterase